MFLLLENDTVYYIYIENTFIKMESDHVGPLAPNK